MLVKDIRIGCGEISRISMVSLWYKYLIEVGPLLAEDAVAMAIWNWEEEGHPYKHIVGLWFHWNGKMAEHSIKK